MGGQLTAIIASSLTGFGGNDVFSFIHTKLECLNIHLVLYPVGSCIISLKLMVRGGAVRNQGIGLLLKDWMRSFRGASMARIEQVSEPWHIVEEFSFGVTETSILNPISIMY